MPEHIVPRIKQHYEYQGNALQCWAAVAITMYRWKNGRSGYGSDMDTLFTRTGGGPFAEVLNFSTEINAELANSYKTLDQAAATVRAANPRWANTPTGLPDHSANRLFTWLGCTSSPITSGTTPGELKEMIRTKGPIAIFKRVPGHLLIIVGFWETDPSQPQIVVFDPEKYNRMLSNPASADVTPASIREDRWLWPHWQAYFAGNLVDGRGWHF